MPGKHTPVPRSCRTCGRDFIGRKDRPTNFHCSRRCANVQKRSPSVVHIEGDIARIQLTTRLGKIRGWAIIDASDAEWASQSSWHWNNGYVARCQSVDGRTRTFRLHRELLGLNRDDDVDVDHIDRDRLNNRRNNLRVLPKGGNGQNQPSEAGSSSQYRGVSWSKASRKWMAYVRVNGTLRHLGFFTAEQEAAAVAKAARLRFLPYAVD